jgi:hypothetical protein
VILSGALVVAVTATPQSSYPGWYQGRATHIHVEVTINGVSRKVTQIAFPESVNHGLRSGVYASRGSNPMTNASDGIFADSLPSELVTPTGSVAGGYSAAFQVGVALSRNPLPLTPGPLPLIERFRLTSVLRQA